MLGLPNLIQQAARMCDADMRTQLFNNIMITGSGSLLPGLAERMNSEVQLSVRFVKNGRKNVSEKTFLCYF